MRGAGINPLGWPAADRHLLLDLGVTPDPPLKHPHSSGPTKPPLGGLTSSTLAGSNVENASRHTGLMGAIQLVHPFTQQVGLQTELGIIQKGALLSPGSGTGTSTLKLSYLEVPAMLRIGFAGKYSNVRPAIFLDPTSVHLTSHSSAGVPSSSEVSEPSRATITDCERSITQRRRMT